MITSKDIKSILADRGCDLTEFEVSVAPNGNVQILFIPVGETYGWDTPEDAIEEIRNGLFGETPLA